MSSFLGSTPPTVWPHRTPWERLPGEVLPVWLIAEQSFCEHRVHLWLKRPTSMVSVPGKASRRSKPSQRLLASAASGSAFHTQLSEEAMPVAIRTLRRLMRTTSVLQLVEWPVTMRHGQLPVAGVPDAVCIESGAVRCVLDYKVTPSNQLQRSHRVQLLLYGLLLQKSGLKPSDALMVCVLVPPASAEAFRTMGAEDREKLASTLHAHARVLVEQMPDRVNWYVGNLQLTPTFGVRLRIFRYDRREALRELAFSSQYWLGERAAYPSRKPRKCAVCLYNEAGICKVAVVPYAGAGVAS